MSGSRSVAVFCGSRLGTDPRWAESAAALGRGLAVRGWRLVYGGGRVGLMGVLADAALAARGEVVGVIPDFLVAREVAHDGLTSRIETGTIHERKHRMAELAQAFVTMPGGFGTFDETIEIVTWRLLGLHAKPVVICNVGGWADAMLAMFERAGALGFADPLDRTAVLAVPDVDAVLERLAQLA